MAGRADFPDSSYGVPVPGAEIRRELDAALAELRGKVSQWMRERHSRGGPVARDVGTTRVLLENPELADRIARLSASDPLHKADEGVIAKRGKIEEFIKGRAEQIDREANCGLSAARGRAWGEFPGLFAEHQTLTDVADQDGAIHHASRFAKRVHLDDLIAKMCRSFADDPGKGLQIVAVHFPALYEQWRRTGA